jgi:arylsulfatase A-like enzyme
MSSAKMRAAFDLTKEPETVRDRYGRNRFGQSCLLSRRLIERGVRFVTVNMFETVFNEITWDMHGTAPFSTVENYRDHVGPMFDHAYATLLEDLHQRGLLSNTLVMATGEFGRTPEINPAGGRDHWPHCWTTLFAGGGVKGGQRIGASDEIGAYPRDRPVKPEEIVATVYHALGIDLNTVISSDGNSSVKVVAPETRPVSELF